MASLFDLTELGFGCLGHEQGDVALGTQHLSQGLPATRPAKAVVRDLQDMLRERN
jgi:hypothetical protein